MKLPVFITLIWAGLLLGVSFLATPAKFLAPSLSMPTALEVGRATFDLLHWSELGLLAVLVLATWQLRHKPICIALCCALIALLLIQQCLLMPGLDLRTEGIISGTAAESAPTSNLHKIYIGVEFLKVCLLCIYALLGNQPSAEYNIKPEQNQKDRAISC